MRLALVLALASCASAPRPTSSATPSPDAIAWPADLDRTSTPQTHREAALLVLELGGGRESMVAMQEVALKQQLELNPSLVPYADTIRAFLEKYTSYDALKHDMARLYMERFTELQLRQIAAFYRTPTGRFAVRQIPKLLEEGAQLGIRKVQEHQAELIEMMMNQPQPPPPAPAP